jgi:hypothetical protein
VDRGPSNVVALDLDLAAVHTGANLEVEAVASRIASAPRTARSAPSNWARTPSPVVRARTTLHCPQPPNRTGNATRRLRIELARWSAVLPSPSSPIRSSPECHGQAYHHGVIACGVGPSDVAGRPAFANSVTLGIGPRILEARNRTKNSLMIRAGIASLGCARCYTGVGQRTSGEYVRPEAISSHAVRSRRTT